MFRQNLLILLIFFSFNYSSAQTSPNPGGVLNTTSGFNYKIRPTELISHTPEDTKYFIIFNHSDYQEVVEWQIEFIEPEFNDSGEYTSYISLEIISTADHYLNVTDYNFQGYRYYLVHGIADTGVVATEGPIIWTADGSVTEELCTWTCIGDKYAWTIVSDAKVVQDGPGQPNYYANGYLHLKRAARNTLANESSYYYEWMSVSDFQNIENDPFWEQWYGQSLDWPPSAGDEGRVVKVNSGRRNFQGAPISPPCMGVAKACGEWQDSYHLMRKALTGVDPMYSCNWNGGTAMGKLNQGKYTGGWTQHAVNENELECNGSFLDGSQTNGVNPVLPDGNFAPCPKVLVITYVYTFTYVFPDNIGEQGYYDVSIEAKHEWKEDCAGVVSDNPDPSYSSAKIMEYSYLTLFDANKAPRNPINFVNVEGKSAVKNLDGTDYTGDFNLFDGQGLHYLVYENQDSEMLFMEFIEDFEVQVNRDTVYATNGPLMAGQTNLTASPNPISGNNLQVEVTSLENLTGDLIITMSDGTEVISETISFGQLNDYVNSFSLNFGNNKFAILKLVFPDGSMKEEVLLKD